MSNREQLFQTSILSEFVTKQDEKLIQERWELFQKFLEKKEYIQDVKEEKYQDGFLKDIFENCLGYTLDSTNHKSFNLEREKKNQVDSKKADGAISIDGHVIGVIELKGQNTKDLDKKGSREQSTVDQAFGYLYSNDTNYAKYVIVSNFDELRFYIKDKTNYEGFSLFRMNYEAFKKLHTVLSYESIKENLPLIMKEKSVTFEKDISDKFYKDYTKFRTELFANILKNNQEIDKLKLLNITQKLIDRIVFILFGEDTGLLPLNTIPTIIKQHEQQQITNLSLFEVYKVYFEAIDKGNEKLNINKYNGGLFADDIKIDSLIIDDEVLDKQAKILSAYKFGSDISVNILGHIFEQSISDLEEITAKIENKDYDKKQSKRKKDGVFYTPAYITKYIVDNTLGKLCEEKRKELDIVEIEAIKRTRKKLTIAQQKVSDNLEAYKEWLLNLKILDPACGSGAFLNQALEFLLEEHKKLQYDFAKLDNLLSSYEVEKSILENNLYGVDINEGAVEIAKLSLWLRTANKGRSLTLLADKIKVGNSLIDDKSVVDNAFVWEDEFKEVFTQGGFDVVIGNPPYIMEDDNKNAFNGLHSLECYQGKTDIWHLFTCKAIEVVKNQGYISFIAKNQWLNSASASNMRKNIYANTNIKLIIDFGVNLIFDNVGQQTMIFILQRDNYNTRHNINYLKFIKEVNKAQIIKSLLNLSKSEYTKVTQKEIPKLYDEKENLTFSSSEKETILNKIDSKKNFEFDAKKEIIQGIIGGPDKAFIVKEKELVRFSSKEKEYLKMLHTNTGQFFTTNTDKYIFYISKNNFNDEDIEDYPNIQSQLLKYNDKLKNRREVLKNSILWFHLWWARDENFFKDGAKLVWAKRTEGKKFTYTEKSMYGTANLFFIKSSRVNLKYITALLNSKLMYFYMRERLKHTGDLLQIDKNQFMKIALYVPVEINEYENLVNIIIESKEKIAKYNKHFDSLNAIDKIEIKEEIEKLETNIELYENIIDKLVYNLYALNDDEIKIVEGI